jgi:predicted metal-dependent hydrolase
VHELLHLKVRNHGRLFRAMMSVHVPNWRTHEVSRTSGAFLIRATDRHGSQRRGGR